MTDIDSKHIKKQRHYFANKGLVKAMVFPVVMWEQDNKKCWVLKNWCLRTMVLEKTLESPLDIKEIKPVSPKGYQSWIFIERTDAEAEGPILWPPDAKSQLISKDPDAGKDWRQEEKGMTEDEMAGWHHWLNGHEFEQTGKLWWTGSPGVLLPMGSHRVGHDWMTEKQHIFKGKEYMTPDQARRPNGFI